MALREGGLGWDPTDIPGVVRELVERVQRPPLLTVVSVTADYSVDILDDLILADSTLGELTVTLPAGVDGMLKRIKKIDAGVNPVTVDPFDTQLIDGQLTRSLATQYATMTITFYDGNWHIT